MLFDRGITIDPELREATDAALAKPSPWAFKANLEAVYQQDRGPARRRRLTITLMVVAAAILGAIVGDTPRTPTVLLDRFAWRGGAAMVLLAAALTARWARTARQEAALVTLAALIGMGVVEVLGERAPTASASAFIMLAVVLVAGIIASGQVRFSTAIVACLACGLAFPLVILAFPGALPFHENSGILGVAIMGFPLVCLAARRNEMVRRAEYLHRLRFEIGERDLQVLNRELTLVSTTDLLTGLANRRHFENEARRVWHDRTQAPFAVALVDVDHFKEFNDAAGHAAGDRCLAAVATALEDAVRDHNDRAARFGGEEFAILFPGATNEALPELGERLRAAVEAMQIPHPGLPGQVVTVSVGITCQSGRVGSIDRVLGDADRLMYDAKKAGRNRVRSEGSLRFFSELWPEAEIGLGDPVA